MPWRALSFGLAVLARFLWGERCSIWLRGSLGIGICQWVTDTLKMRIIRYHLSYNIVKVAVNRIICDLAAGRTQIANDHLSLSYIGRFECPSLVRALQVDTAPKCVRYASTPP